MVIAVMGQVVAPRLPINHSVSHSFSLFNVATTLSLSLSLSLSLTEMLLFVVRSAHYLLPGVACTGD